MDVTYVTRYSTRVLGCSLPSSEARAAKGFLISNGTCVSRGDVTVKQLTGNRSQKSQYKHLIKRLYMELEKRVGWKEEVGYRDTLTTYSTYLLYS